MSPIKDANLNVGPVSSDLPLTADHNSAVLDINYTPLHGMAVALHVPAVTGHTTTDTTTVKLDVVIHASTSTTVTTASRIVGELRGIAVEGDYIIPFVAPTARSILVEYDVTVGTSDSPNFSTVSAYIVEQVGAEWSRVINFR
jgi:hypothetical protein